MKWKRCRNQDICKRYICEEDIGQKKLIYTFYAISGSKNVGKPEIQVHALKKIRYCIGVSWYGALPQHWL